MSEPWGAVGASRQPPEKAKEKGMTEAIELKSGPLPGLLNGILPLTVPAATPGKGTQIGQLLSNKLPNMGEPEKWGKRNSQ